MWWLYFDRQADTVLRGSTMSVVVYSYAHIPLLIGLAATSAGLRLLIDGAGRSRLGAGASAAFVGGVVLYVLALVGTRSVTVGGSRRTGVSLKLAFAAALVVLVLAQRWLPPAALAAATALVLAALVVAERALTSESI